MSKNKTKTETSKTHFHFWIVFCSSLTKYSYCESENHYFGDSVVILNRDSKVV